MGSTTWRGDPVNAVDPSGNFICFAGPPGFLICLVAGAVLLVAGGCSNPTPPADSCPPLPENLRGGSFGNLPRAEALVEVQKLHNIQLPPGFQFEYAPSGPAGYTGETHWFDKSNKFGKVSIYEWAFKGYAVNRDFGGVSSAYDIEAIMVHEALHAWQVYSIMKLAEDPNSGFKRANTGSTYQPDYTKIEWYEKYGKVFEWEAYTYVEQHTPPLCPSADAKTNNSRQKQNYLPPSNGYPLISGIPTIDRIPLVEYPLP
jgi:hypothetical protein